MGKTNWTHAEMIAETVDWWGDPDVSDSDCEVREADDGAGNRCLIVLHRPTGRTSTEAADAGRWHRDGTAYGDETPVSRAVKLSARDWDRLESIARREGLEWGGVPSRSDAVRWLIARDSD